MFTLLLLYIIGSLLWASEGSEKYTKLNWFFTPGVLVIKFIYSLVRR